MGGICIIFKLTLVLDVIVVVLGLIIRKILYKDLSLASVKPLNKNCLNQALSYKGHCKYWRLDYFKEKEIVAKEIKSDFKIDFKKLSELCKGGVIKVKTNKWAYSNVIIELGNGYETLIDDTTKKTDIQCLEKLQIMSSFTVWKHIFTSKFWKTVFRKEEIYTYYIKV